MLVIGHHGTSVCPAGAEIKNYGAPVETGKE